MRKNVRMLTEAAIMIAFSFVLSNIRLFQLPNGGSVTPGSMVPIVLFAIRWTGKREETSYLKSLSICFIVAAVEGTLQFILGPKWSMHPVSIFFDYIIAFGVLGFAGIFGKRIAGVAVGVVLTVFLRYVCHVISGAVVFYEYAGAKNPWIYSIGYNATFMGIELVLTVIITLALIQVPVIKNVRIQE